MTDLTWIVALFPQRVSHASVRSCLWAAVVRCPWRWRRLTSPTSPPPSAVHLVVRSLVCSNVWPTVTLVSSSVCFLQPEPVHKIGKCRRLQDQFITHSVERFFVMVLLTYDLFMNWFWSLLPTPILWTDSSTVACFMNWFLKSTVCFFAMVWFWNLLFFVLWTDTEIFYPFLLYDLILKPSVSCFMTWFWNHLSLVL